jgi:hypothetical protein
MFAAAPVQARYLQQEGLIVWLHAGMLLLFDNCN